MGDTTVLDADTLEVVSLNPDGISVIDTAQALGITEDKSPVRRAFDRLVRAGKVQKRGERREALYLPVEELPALARLSDVSKRLMDHSLLLSELYKMDGTYPKVKIAAQKTSADEALALAKEAREVKDQISAIFRKQDQDGSSGVSNRGNESEVLVSSPSSEEEPVLGMAGGDQR